MGNKHKPKAMLCFVVAAFLFAWAISGVFGWGAAALSAGLLAAAGWPAFWEKWGAEGDQGEVREDVRKD